MHIIPATSDSAEPPALLLGRYQMLERIGEGGMGVVWRCFDIDLEEQVAIKFLREEFARDDALRASFRREVKLARRVTHPNVVRVFEFGRYEDSYFLTMEYIAGVPLDTLLERRADLGPDQVLSFALGLCRGLAAAHVAGIVHGDIKPGNVLIAPDRGPVITDFGISRVLSEAHIGFDGGWHGTPLYMAPELFQGAGMSKQSDVYAFGVVMLEVLTGGVPWPTDDIDALVAAKCRESPDLRALSCFPAWAPLINECLCDDPGGRPVDARVLLSRLVALRRGA